MYKRQELSALLRTVKDPRVSEGMLTITRVDTTSDLRYARVYISALNLSLIHILLDMGGETVRFEKNETALVRLRVDF